MNLLQAAQQTSAPQVTAQPATQQTMQAQPAPQQPGGALASRIAALQQSNPQRAAALQAVMLRRQQQGNGRPIAGAPGSQVPVQVPSAGQFDPQAPSTPAQPAPNGLIARNMRM